MNVKKHPVVQRIEAEVEQTLDDFGFELVQIKFGGAGGGRTLTVTMDGPEGVGARDCQKMNRRLSMLLDSMDPIPGAYTLIVSSPDLDRPLTRDSDFERFEGRTAAVRHRPAGEDRRTIQGTLRGTHDGVTIVETDQGPVEVCLADVEEAHLVYDWDAEEQP